MSALIMLGSNRTVWPQKNSEAGPKPKRPSPIDRNSVFLFVRHAAATTAPCCSRVLCDRAALPAQILFDTLLRGSGPGETQGL